MSVSRIRFPMRGGIAVDTVADTRGFSAPRAVPFIFQFLKMGQHGVAGWWPVIFAMLAVFCLCPEKISMLPPQVIFNSTTIPVLSLFIFPTSPSTLAALKAPFLHPDQPMATTPNPMPSKHTDQPLAAPSLGAGYYHIHPSDVPVKN